MKMYYVANARMPQEKAHGIQIAKTCEAFVEAGVDLELVIPRRGKSATSLRDFYHLRRDIKVTYLPAIDLYTKGRFLFALSSLSFICGYLGYLSLKALKGEQFSIYSIDMDTFSSAPLAFVGRPFFSEIHGARTSSMATRYLFKHVSGIIAINEYVEETLENVFGMEKERILVEGNGVDLAVFGTDTSRDEARTQLGVIEAGPIAMYVGRIYPWKGLGILDEVARLRPEVIFYMVGGTKEEYMKVTGTSAVAENIKFLGIKESHEIPGLIACADVLLVVGTKENEGSYKHTSPMKAFEYMAARRAIVASATPAIKSILSEREAYLYEPDNAEDLVQKIDEALVDHGGERIERAHAKALTHTWGRRAERILAFMHSVAPDEK